MAEKEAKSWRPLTANLAGNFWATAAREMSKTKDCERGPLRKDIQFRYLLTLLTGHNERVLDGLLLKADHLRKAQAGQQLDIVDFLDCRLELQEGCDSAASQDHDRQAAFLL